MPVLRSHLPDDTVHLGQQPHLAPQINVIVSGGTGDQGLALGEEPDAPQTNKRKRVLSQLNRRQRGNAIKDISENIILLFSLQSVKQARRWR